MKGAFIMKSRILFLGAAAMALAPALASAAPGGNGSTSNGSTTAAGSNHSNGPSMTGQPNQDCEELVASGQGSTPGNSSSAPGSAFNPGGTSGSVYAGEQPQNSRNSASVSQYDTACAHQPQ
jgi:hypothetical protein